MPEKRVYNDKDLLHAASVLISFALANGGSYATKVLLDDGREFEVTVKPLATNEVPPWVGRRFAGIVRREN